MESSRPIIRSTKNPLLQRVRAVGAGRERGAILLEGTSLVAEARSSGIELECVLVSLDRAAEADALEREGVPVQLVLDSILASASRLTSSPGILALAREPRSRELADLSLGEDALVAVAAGLQDPGNLGALVRTAEASGATALVLCGAGCSPWNTKALRGSMGSLLRLPLCRFERAQDALQALEERGFRSVRAATRGGIDHARFDWSGRIALWFTGESGDLAGGEARADRFECVSISMAGEVESLNVTAAAAVLLFAAGRGRTPCP